MAASHRGEARPPVHDVGQPVHADGVSGKQGWVKNPGWRHDYEGEAILQKCVTNLQEEENTQHPHTEIKKLMQRLNNRLYIPTGRF